MGPVIGTSSELVDHFGQLRDNGVERTYVWFSDFAQLQTIAAFGQEVIAQLSRTSTNASDPQRGHQIH
jgi:hypothetical protein